MDEGVMDMSENFQHNQQTDDQPSEMSSMQDAEAEMQEPMQITEMSTHLDSEQTQAEEEQTCPSPSGMCNNSGADDSVADGNPEEQANSQSRQHLDAAVVAHEQKESGKGEEDEGELSNQEDAEGESVEEAKQPKTPPEPEPKLSKLDRLKNLQFAKEDRKKKGAPIDSPRVRSFLHERGADPFSVPRSSSPKAEKENASNDGDARDTTKERSRSDRDREREREKERRTDRTPSPSRERRRRRRHSSEEEVGEKKVNESLEHHPHDHLPPPVLFTRCNQLVVKGEHHASTITDEELRVCISDFLDLDHELNLLSEKRKKLKVEMTAMIEEEVNVIKRMHAQMPPQLQQIIRIDGDKVTLVENFGSLPLPLGAPIIGGPPPGVVAPPGFPPLGAPPSALFPAAPSMLGRAPDIGPNGMGSFSIAPSGPPPFSGSAPINAAGPPIGQPPPNVIAPPLLNQGIGGGPGPMTVPPPAMNLPPPGHPQVPSAPPQGLPPISSVASQPQQPVGVQEPGQQAGGQMTIPPHESRSPKPLMEQSVVPPQPKRGRTPPMPPPSQAADYSVPPPTSFSMPPPSVITSQPPPSTAGPQTQTAIPPSTGQQTSMQPPSVVSSTSVPPPTQQPHIMDFSKPPPGLIPPSGPPPSVSEPPLPPSSTPSSTSLPPEPQRSMPRAPHINMPAGSSPHATPPPHQQQSAGGNAPNPSQIDIARNLSSFLTSKLKQEVSSSFSSASASPGRSSTATSSIPSLLGPPLAAPSSSMLVPPPTGGQSGGRNTPQQGQTKGQQPTRASQNEPMNLGTLRIGPPPGAVAGSPNRKRTT